MTTEDKEMPLKQIIKISAILIGIGLLIVIFGGAYRGLGSVMIFTAILLWAYRLFLRPAANYFQRNTLKRLENWYEKLLNSSLRGWKPRIIAIGGIVLFVLAFMSFGVSVQKQRTKIEFFPDNKPNQIIVYIEYPEGTDIKKTNRITKEIEKTIVYKF